MANLLVNINNSEAVTENVKLVIPKLIISVNDSEAVSDVAKLIEVQVLMGQSFG